MFFLVSALCGCHSSPTVPISPEKHSEAVKPPAVAPPSAVDSPSNWEYNTMQDDMTGEAIKIACTISSNNLYFGSPYEGGSTGTLCFRKKGKQLNAWVKISSGQFECGIEDCSLQMKFDDGPIQRFTAVESESHDSNMLFIEPESRLLAQLLKAKSLKLQALYFEEGRQVLNFDVSGLDKSRIS